MGVGDWIIARSDNFKFLMHRLRDHQITTQSTFKRVKQKHRLVDEKIDNQEKRIKKLERILRAVQEVPVMRVIRKKRKR